MTTNAYLQGKAAILTTFTVKGYKSWRGREGVGASTTLYRDGKKIGWCTDEGNGGVVDFRAYTREDDQMVREFVKALPPYQFNDMWVEQYHEAWDGRPQPEQRSWKLFDFANVMLEQAEEEDFKVFQAKLSASRHHVTLDKSARYIGKHK
jgi:hypothetical protein